MGHLTRKPGIDEPHDATAKPKSPYSPNDEMGALLTKSACRCCGCGNVILQRHLTFDNGHLFCPDCYGEVGSAACTRADCRINVSLFLDKHPAMRPGYVPPQPRRYVEGGYDCDAD